MTIQSEIQRIEGAKADIAASIAGKGVTVPTGTKIDGMADLIDQIEQGGGGSAFPEPRYIRDSNTAFRLYYYSHIEDTINLTNASGCAPEVTDVAKAKTFISSHRTMEEAAATVSYIESEGGWCTEQWGMYTVIGDGTDAAVLSAAGITVNRSATPASFKMAEGEPKIYADEISHADYAANDSNLESIIFGADQAKDPIYVWRSDLGKSIRVPVAAIIGFEFNNTTYTKPQFWWEPVVFSKFPNLVFMGATPDIFRHIDIGVQSYVGDFYGLKGLSKLNSDLYLAVVNDAPSGTQQLAPLCYDLESFSSNIYLPNYVGNETYNSPLSFTELPNMTGTVYWGEDVAYINANAFSTTVATDPIYAVGVKFAGPGAAAAKALLPDLDGTSGRYRKIILAE